MKQPSLPKKPSLPIGLPVLGSEPKERADAARNRQLVLAAAQKLFAQAGVSCTSMDAIAAEAGVGKGTVFRRFGDRATLALALIDESERTLQNAILTGPPPLGPGAPPCVRVVAFGAALLDRLRLHTDLLLEAEAGAYARSEPYAVHWLHVRSLVAQARPGSDIEYTTDVLLGALTAQVFVHQTRVRGMELDRLKAGYAELAERMLSA
jgi:AcrR family transcriptional regulator